MKRYITLLKNSEGGLLVIEQYNDNYVCHRWLNQISKERVICLLQIPVWKKISAQQYQLKEVKDE